MFWFEHMYMESCLRLKLHISNKGVSHNNQQTEFIAFPL